MTDTAAPQRRTPARHAVTTRFTALAILAFALVYCGVLFLLLAPKSLFTTSPASQYQHGELTSATAPAD